MNAQHAMFMFMQWKTHKKRTHASIDNNAHSLAHNAKKKFLIQSNQTCNNKDLCTVKKMQDCAIEQKIPFDAGDVWSPHVCVAMNINTTLHLALQNKNE